MKTTMVVLIMMATMSISAQSRQGSFSRISLDREGFSFETGLVAGLKIHYYSPVIKWVYDFPEEIRFVPVHPDDQLKVSLESNGVISDGRITPEREMADIIGEIGIESQLKFHFLRLVARVGGGYTLTAPLCPASPSSYREENRILDEERIRERDYLRSPGSPERGRGTALTYYRSYVKERFLPRYNLELWTKVAGFKIKSDYYFDGRDFKTGDEFSSLHLLVGFKKSPYRLMAENGWDRWNSFEKKETFELMEIRIRAFYAGIVYEIPKKEFVNTAFLRIGVLDAGKEKITEKVSVEYGKSPVFVEIGWNLWGKLF